MQEIRIPKAPLFRDPIFDGAADPTIIWNREEQSWWILYTNRRANVDCQGFSYVHGTDIGIAESRDGGQSWLYRGVLQGLEFERGRNTFWAPEILWHEGLYHMYVSYVKGIPVDWTGDRNIIHYTSKNLWDWRLESVIELSSKRVIDACILRLPDRRWRMWYKDEANNSYTYSADSTDLYNWKVVGPVITDCAHEGPNVFIWRGCYWMVTDPWCGLGVYRSEDGEKWERRKNILDLGGTRCDDGTEGHHADILVQGQDAFIFYFTHPEYNKGIKTIEDWPYRYRRTSIQAAKLEIEGRNIVCDRNKPFDFFLENPKHT